MSDVLTGLVRFVHIISAVTWLGATMLFSMLIAPRVLRDGPPMMRRPFLEAILVPLTRYFAISSTLTIVFGFLLIGQIFGYTHVGDAFQVKGYGLALGIGVVAAFAMAAIGFGVVGPTAKKMLGMMQAMPAPAPGGGAPPAPPAEMMALGKRMGMMSMLTVLLGAIALGGMVVAVNYVR